MINFVDTEAMVNGACMDMLGNATLAYLSGAIAKSADGVFRKPSAGLLGDLVQGDLPTFTARTDLIGTLTYGQAVAINSVNYTVARIEPDGTGVTVLTLKNA